MPNFKGGKNYKKMKHMQAAKPEFRDIGEGQMIGKVMRMLGDRNVQVYCNDNVERICKIRGALRKKVWIATGDIVLLSLRILSSIDDDSESDEDIAKAAPSNGAMKGDILHRYGPDEYSKLKKLDGVNKRLFNSGYEVSKNDDDMEDYFDNEADDAPEEDDSESDDAPKKTPWKRPSAAKHMDNEDVDIDAI